MEKLLHFTGIAGDDDDKSSVIFHPLEQRVDRFPSEIVFRQRISFIDEQYAAERF